MSFWMREASLQIGSKKYSMDNLYFEFEVLKVPVHPVEYRATQQ